MNFDPTLTVPPEIVDLAVRLGRWMEQNDCTSIMGIGPVFPLQREAAQLRAIVAFADARINNSLPKSTPESFPWR
jgi:hypothetical protein